MSNALEILIITHLLSSIQRLYSANTLCFTLDKFDTYVLLYFLPAIWIFKGKGALDRPPLPPPPPKKGVFLWYNNIFPNILCKISISSGIFHDLLTKI